MFWEFGTELFSFAFFPDFNLAISELAELAEPEAWDFSDEPPELRSNKILKNYLEYTFRKLKSDNQISFYQSRRYACFNTGLYTKGLENIYVKRQIQVPHKRQEFGPRG